MARLPGTGIFMSSTTTHAPPVMVHMVERERALHEKVVLLTVLTETIPEVPEERRLAVKSLGHDIYQVIATYGFMQEPNVPKVLGEAASRLGLSIDSEQTHVLPGARERAARQEERHGGRSPRASSATCSETR